MRELKIEYIDIEKLVPYENNAKLHPESQVKDIMQSITLYGMNDPIAIDEKTMTIIEGHGRLVACKNLGFDKAPVIKLGHLSPEEQQAYRIVHNKLTMNTDFDMMLLNQEIDLLMPENELLVLPGFNNYNSSELNPESAKKEDSIIPEKGDNIIVRLSFHPGLWLGKRSELINIFDKLKINYNCKIKIDE